MSDRFSNELLNNFEFLREQARDRYKNSKDANEKAQASMEIESIEFLFKAYYYGLDAAKRMYDGLYSD